MKRYQIFVSSTYSDLIEERQAVLESILKLRHIPVGMEQFVAANDEQFGYIQRLIDETDYYVILIGNRYGSIASDGVSYTEKEFDYAVSKGIPILAFIHSSPDSLPVNKSEKTASARKQLTRFREKVMNNRLVSLFSWDSPVSLSREVVVALTIAINDYPRPGWERANDASILQSTPLNPSEMSEAEKLSDLELRLLTKIALTQKTEHTITPEIKITEQTPSKEAVELSLRSLVKCGYLIYYYSTDPSTGFYQITEKAEKVLKQFETTPKQQTAVY